MRIIKAKDYKDMSRKAVNILFNHVNVKADHIHVPEGSNPDAKIACSEYDELIQSVGGIDLQLLGIGEDALSLLDEI